MSVRQSWKIYWYRWYWIWFSQWKSFLRQTSRYLYYWQAIPRESYFNDDNGLTSPSSFGGLSRARDIDINPCTSSRRSGEGLTGSDVLMVSIRPFMLQFRSIRTFFLLTPREEKLVLSLLPLIPTLSRAEVEASEKFEAGKAGKPGKNTENLRNNSDKWWK